MVTLLKTVFYLLTFSYSVLVHLQVSALENTVNSEKMKAGFQAFESICSSCHTHSFETGSRAAPPISKVKLHYLRDTSSFSEFKESMANFINEPSANIKMKGAHAKFGAMPKLSLDDETISNVIYYIYHTPLESADWNTSTAQSDARKYKRSKGQTLNTKEDYKKNGLMIAMQTKSALGSQLKKAKSEKGVNGAISFCNEQAIPITNGMSNKLNASIKRVSDRPRNPNNAASEAELVIINSLKQDMNQGQKPTPKVVEYTDKMVGYYPIVTNGMCLGCHGKPEKQIDSKTLAVIKDLYPQDKAIGYDANQLRGLFVVEMEKESD